ncbi:MAG: riboflavin kinase, partial [Planctomycetota bacterium]
LTYNEQLDTVEVYIEGYSGNLYRCQLEVELHRKLRDERRFASPEQLVEQIQDDRQQLLEWLGK